MAIKHGSKVDSNFSMSSMTDIVFLLLIFFMISSTLVTPASTKDLTLPKSSHQVSGKPSTTVSINKHREYFVEGKRVQFSNIERTLKQVLGNDPEIYVSLYVDESVPFSEVGKIRDIAIRNKYKLILATRPK